MAPWTGTRKRKASPCPAYDEQEPQFQQIAPNKRPKKNDTTCSSHLLQEARLDLADSLAKIAISSDGTLKLNAISTIQKRYISTIIHVLQVHPTLASECFSTIYSTGALPLHHLVCARASLQTIKLVYTIYPPGLAHVSSTGRLPLHDACYLGSNAEVLQFLTQQYPPALEQYTPQGSLPIHAFLKRRYNEPFGAPKTIQTMVELRPETAAMVDHNGYNALACAFYGINDGSVMNYIADQLVQSPSIPESFTVPIYSDLNLATAGAIRRLLPKLRRLHCLSRDATQDGMVALLDALKGHPITHLTLRFPRNIMTPLGGPRRAIERAHRAFLKDNRTLEFLCYQGGWCELGDQQYDDVLLQSLRFMPRILAAANTSHFKHLELAHCRFSKSDDVGYLLTDYAMPRKVTFRNIFIQGPCWTNPNRMASLSVQELQFLNVHMSRTACDAFGKELPFMRSLRRLTLALPFGNQEYIGATVVTQKLLSSPDDDDEESENVGLEYLNLSYDIKLDMVKLCRETLVHNTTLLEFHMPQALGTVTSRKALAHTLEHYNTTLQRVTLDKRDQYGCCPHAQWIRLLTKLNRLGRGKVRRKDFTMTKFVQLLIAASNTVDATTIFQTGKRGILRVPLQPRQHTEHDTRLLNVRYKLLKESPGLWSSQ